ncbi:SI1L3 protein, partial [Centropus bengalensis]|nr:SI1L3 protein [Centropus bengalensis]
MGVRARIADWPPRRDPTTTSTTSTSTTASSSCRPPASGLQPQPHPGVSAFQALQRLARRRSKEAEVPEGWSRSPAPLRHRSSSEVTLSECDGQDAAEPRGAGGAGGGGGGATKLGGGAGLFREYGSTSSIDVQGISEQSFFEMLNEFRTKRPLGPAVPAPGSHGGTKSDARNGAREDAKEKPRRRCPKGDESIFKKLRSGRAEGDAAKEVEEPRLVEPPRTWVCQKSFAHYDVQSMLFDLNAVATSRAAGAQRRNTTTGASAASAARAGALGASDPAFASTEDLNCKENLEHDLGDNTSNELLLSCPHFRNEIGGAAERSLSFSGASAAPAGAAVANGGFLEPPFAGHPSNASVSVLEVPPELQRNPNRLKLHSVEHVDLGARYYRDHFHGKEHSNYFGVDEKLGPVAVSIKRE